MAKRGYKPAAEADAVGSIIDEVNALGELSTDLLQRARRIAGNRLITRTELKRDLGYSDSAIRLLEKTGQLIAIRTESGRVQYGLAQALAFRILQPGLNFAKGIRTVRKHANITTVNRDFWRRITELQCA